MKHTIGTLCIIILFSVILSLFLPINAASADGSNDDYTKEIVTLLEDPQYAETITLLQDVNAQDRYCIEVFGPEDHEKVLDLNGHKLLSKYIINHANLRVIDSADDGALVINRNYFNNYGTLTVDGATIIKDGSGCVVTNWWTGTFHLVSGNVCISTEMAHYALENKGGVCIVDGGSISGSVAIHSRQGSELYPVYGYDEAGNKIGSSDVRAHDGTLTINGGLIEGDLLVWNTDVAITGGTIRGDAGGLEYRNATGELVMLPKPTYELHEENGEMKRGYWDVSVDDWFYAPVQSLMGNGVLDYGEDGSFGPSEPLTRGQAAALLIRACGVEPELEMNGLLFNDVTEVTPLAKYIHAAWKAGLLSGDGQGGFHPEDAITRQEFAILVMNAVDRKYLDLPDETKSITFSDEAAIAAWARDAVMEGATHGLWQGVGDGDFKPQSTISRAETATILAHLLGRG